MGEGEGEGVIGVMGLKDLEIRGHVDNNDVASAVAERAPGA
jgi:hypothetical protein